MAAGPCYIALAWTAQKTPPPATPPLLHCASLAAIK
jgi:hypothetical protein